MIRGERLSPRFSAKLIFLPALWLRGIRIVHTIHFGSRRCALTQSAIASRIAPYTFMPRLAASAFRSFHRSSGISRTDFDLFSLRCVIFSAGLDDFLGFDAICHILS